MSAAVIYVLAVLAANLTATLFLPLAIIPQFGVLVSVGTLIFGITFTQRDRMHHRGRPFVYKVIVLSAVLNFILLASFRYLWGLPTVAYFESMGWEWLAGAAAMLQDSGLRVFIASFLAIVLAESVNTEVYQYYRERTWLGRVSRSNGISIPLDSLIFNLIAFAGSPFFPWPVLVAVICGEIVAKFIVSMVYALIIGPAKKP